MSYKKTLVCLILFSTIILHAWAQNKAMVKGIVINQQSQLPVSDAQIALLENKLITSSDANGGFNFNNVRFGKQTLKISGNNIVTFQVDIDINKAIVDLGTITIKINESIASGAQLNIPVISLDDNTLSTDDDGTKTQQVSGLLSASKDPFINAAAYTFGTYRFQMRGYDRNQQTVLINGAPMNDVETGDAYWGQWGGLNDVFRSRNNTYGLQNSDYTFGGLNGSTIFDASAANQRKQTKVAYSLTNRSYRNRLMFTQSSGLMANGFAYSISLSKRWAQEGYVAGTFYDAYSYYLGISKKLKKSTFNFISFGAPTRRGKAAPAVQEAYDLAGTNFYNPNWGYQNGEKRNAKVANSFQPAFIANWDFNPNSTFHLSTTLSYQFGKNENSTLDWYNGQDPRPDYYRKLPSYYATENPALASEITAAIQSNPNLLQLDWDRFYQANRMNRETILNANGIVGNSVIGNRSIYVLSNDVDAIQKTAFNTTLHKEVDERVNLYGGFSYISQKTESYRALADLLGGDFYVNYNQFAARTYAGNPNYIQNDLNNPNKILQVGDRYNYNYINRFSRSQLWGQATFTYSKFDAYIAANIGNQSFTREGLFKNGLYENNSFGLSNKYAFTTFGLKGGFTYKVDGRNYFFANAMIGADAPTVDNTFISPRTRNSAILDPTTQNMSSAELGYLKRAPKLNIRAVGYVSDIKDATEIKRFYNDDPNFQTFVNYALQHVNMRFIGTELAVNAVINPSLSITAAAAIGQAFYTNRPTVSVTRDNDTNQIPVSRQVYLENYYLASGPQTATTLGFNYKSKSYWFANVNFNYFARNYIDVNPDRRTAQAIDLLTPGSEKWNNVLNQEVAPTFFTTDLSIGKSFLVNKLLRNAPRSTMLYFNLGISNLFNNTDIINGGFEQLRYDFSGGNENKFPRKYFYGLGRNYFINISLKF
jgi:hypothetical protein